MLGALQNKINETSFIHSLKQTDVAISAVRWRRFFVYIISIKSTFCLHPPFCTKDWKFCLHITRLLGNPHNEQTLSLLSKYSHCFLIEIINSVLFSTLRDLYELKQLNSKCIQWRFALYLILIFTPDADL